VLRGLPGGDSLALVQADGQARYFVKCAGVRNSDRRMVGENTQPVEFAWRYFCTAEDGKDTECFAAIFAALVDRIMDCLPRSVLTSNDWRRRRGRSELRSSFLSLEPLSPFDLYRFLKFKDDVLRTILGTDFGSFVTAAWSFPGNAKRSFYGSASRHQDHVHQPDSLASTNNKKPLTGQ